MKAAVSRSVRLRSEWLLAAGAAFILLPDLLFFATWLRLELAIPILLLVGGTLYLETRTSRPSPELTIPWGVLFVVALITFAWLSISGIGGLGPQRLPDYDKHNAMLRDLIEQPWPIAYASRAGATPTHLTYYLAYYLIPALVGKLGGWAAANLASVVFAGTGTFLVLLLAALYLVPRFENRAKDYVTLSASLLLFCLIGGLDLVGSLWELGIPDQFPRLQYWSTKAGYLQFTPHALAYFWTPQHAIPGWLATGLLLHFREDPRFLRVCGLLTSALLLWSPFVAIGYGVLALALLLPKVWRRDWDDFLSPANLVAAPIVAVVSVAYFSSNPSHLTQRWLYPVYLDVVVQFLLVEVIVFLPIAWRAARPHRLLFVASVVSLCLIPMYSFGQYNDFCMRVSIPALTVLWLTSIRAAFSFRPLWRIASLTILMTASLASLEEIHYTVFDAGVVWRQPKLSHVASVASFRGFMHDQYIGVQDSFFFRNLARPVTPSPRDAR